MSDRCFVKVQWDAASGGGSLRRAVGGFLRYIQHRDLHPDSPTRSSRVGGMLKYAAYREGASSRAELCCAEGRAGSKERKDFAAFVGRSIESSRPQLFQTRDGRTLDRRRAVYRFIISPERAAGLDLDALLRETVARLAADAGVDDLRWLAAIHRNTAHHHIHLVMAGMYQDARGAYRRLDISPPRLAGIKESIACEIQRQRELARLRLPEVAVASAPRKRSAPRVSSPAARRPVYSRPVSFRRALRAAASTGRRRVAVAPVSLINVRAGAEWFAWKSARDAYEESRNRGWEHAA